MNLSQDYTKFTMEQASRELKGAALNYLNAQPERAVWKKNSPGSGYLIATTQDPNAGGKSFKQFLPEGVHLGWAHPNDKDVLVFFRKDFQAFPPSPAPAQPAKVYGEDYQVYGAATCRYCNQPHDGSRTIRESPATRFKLLQFAAEIASITDALVTKQVNFIKQEVSRVSLPQAPKNMTLEQKNARKSELNSLQAAAEKQAVSIVKLPLLAENNRQHSAWRDRLAADASRPQPNPLTADCRDRKPTMLGLLACGNGPDARTYVAASGNFADDRFRHIASLRGYVVCDTPKKPRTTLAKGTIPDVFYSGSRGEHAQEPGTCAAPRMISQAIKDKCEGVPSDWRMSEIWYWRSNMPASDLQWVPGLTAYSCQTCQNLIPLFLCPELRENV